MQVPLGGRGPGHAADCDDCVAVLVMGQVPDRAEPGGIAARRDSERGDVLGRRRVSERGELGRVLAGELAAQRIRVGARRHQSREPADGRLVEVFVQVVGDAAQVPGELERAPLGQRRRLSPARVVESARRTGRSRRPPRRTQLRREQVLVAAQTVPANGCAPRAPSKPTPAAARAVVWPECQSYPLFATLGCMPAMAASARRRGRLTAAARYPYPELPATGGRRGGACGRCEKKHTCRAAMAISCLRTCVRNEKTLVTALRLAS